MVTTWACPDGVMDRISKLPEGILHHILSFLTLKQVKQLSLLSNTWKQVSATHPIFNFTQDVFLKQNFGLRKISLENVIKEKSRLKQNLLTIFNAVDQSLRPFHDRRLSINEFELSLTPQPHHSDLSSVYLSRIYQWIQQAIDSNVQILTISTGFDCGRPTPPQCDLFSRSFNTSLKKLSLQYVSLTDQLPQSLFTNLEVLTISRCCGLRKIDISGPTKLKKIDLSCKGDLELVHIEALSLIEALFYCDSLKVLDIRQCKNIRYITMKYMTILAKWLDEGLDYYPALESLHLSGCYELKVAKISSNNLKSLELYFLSGLAAIDLNTPSLTEFTYYGGNVDFSSNVSALASATVYFYPNYAIQAPLDLEHVKLLSKFNGWCKVKVLYYNRHEKKLRERMVPPLCNVEKLEITITGDEELELTSTELIDSLFWISPHPEILLVKETSPSSSPADKHKHTFKSFKDKTFYEEEFSSTSHDGLATSSKEEFATIIVLMVSKVDNCPWLGIMSGYWPTLTMVY
ncbi:hypothetical protein ACFE04_000186 [Oxalis oulophora]